MARKILIFIFFAVCVCPVAAKANDNVVLVEVESFAEKGGWVVDQQFMDLMGSPYLLAHGLGEPVPDASDTVSFPEAGDYKVWVRTRDWVAPWKAPGTPGKFQVLIDGEALLETFGTVSDPWHWQPGGTVTVGKTALVSLHDLTGFEGRCDAILFSRDAEFEPPEGDDLKQLRTKVLGWDLAPEDKGHFDLVVVGGGVAGTAAAVSASRQGLQVALIQDRPILGGNGSSEIRVWPEGKINHQPYPRIGDIVGELIPDKPLGNSNAVDAHYYDDARKLRVVKAESNITLLLNHRAISATAQNSTIESVVAQHVHSGRRISVTGKFFLDSTGDGVLGAMVGADFELKKTGNLGSSNLWKVDAIEKNEPQIKCECEDEDPLSLAFTPSKTEQPFPRTPWAIDLSDIKFPGRKGESGQWRTGDKPLSNLGGWFWESGSSKNPIKDIEWIRDYNFRAMYGAWDTLKNVDGQFPNYRLKWAAYIMGKRESRRLIGDVIVTADHFRQSTQWPDPAFPCTWHIDLHSPDPKYDDPKLAEPFIAKATTSKEYRYEGPYWAPYRCLYSRNINNLFMAGRDISVSHDGLGAVRVMRTCGMMGETVGKAAWIAVRHKTTPRGVYDSHLQLLKDLMKEPGAKRRESLKGPLVVPPGVVISEGNQEAVDIASLPGLVIDDRQAKFKGDWQSQGSLTGYVGMNYRYSSDPDATAVFPISVSESGNYQVLVTWQPHKNRARNLTIEIESDSGAKSVVVDQTKPAAGEDSFQSLGEFQFEADSPGKVTFRAKGAKGIVHVDAVQLLKK